MYWSLGGPNVTCASPAEQKGRNLLDSINLCSTSSPVTAHTDHKSPTPPVTSQHSKEINSTPTTTSTSQNCTVSKSKTYSMMQFSSMPIILPFDVAPKTS